MNAQTTTNRDRRLGVSILIALFALDAMMRHKRTGVASKAGLAHWARPTWLAFIVVVAPIVPFNGAIAQSPPVARCAACSSCDLCVRSPSGATSCNFLNGCCAHSATSCNPALAMNVDMDDRRFVNVDGDKNGVLVVRLEGSVFGTWSCVDGILREAYRETGGMFRSLDGRELEAFRSKYPLDQYISLLSDRLHARAGAGA